MKLPRSVYCIGLGGVGVSAVAKYLLAQGVAVAGSDLVHSPLVDDVVRLGGRYFPTADPARLTPDIDLVVYTDDCGPDHPERQAAARLGIPSQNFSETLGWIMDDYPVRLAIAGTNGKSTTTALTGLLLDAAGRRPTVFVGSRVSQFNGNLRLGSRDVFVAEADEYRDHFLRLRPTIGLITNIELDHVNYFHSLERLIDSFHRFADRIDTGGRLIVNGDDPILRREFAQRPQTISFGFSDFADLRVERLTLTAGQQTFSLQSGGRSLGQFVLHLPGRFNVLNAAAAVAAALAAGTAPDTMPRVIADFRGVWRRFEILTSPQASVTVVNDYAHHPTAVRGTLEGARSFFPGRRLIAVFQPHHHNRLTALFNEFAAAFGSADQTIMTEVYTVPGRQPDVGDTKNGQDLATAIAALGRTATYAATPADAADIAKRLVQVGDVVIIMGAGDIWTIAQPLASHYER